MTESRGNQHPLRAKHIQVNKIKYHLPPLSNYRDGNTFTLKSLKKKKIILFKWWNWQTAAISTQVLSPSSANLLKNLHYVIIGQTCTRIFLLRDNLQNRDDSWLWFLFLFFFKSGYLAIYLGKAHARRWHWHCFRLIYKGIVGRLVRGAGARGASSPLRSPASVYTEWRHFHRLNSSPQAFAEARLTHCMSNPWRGLRKLCA